MPPAPSSAASPLGDDAALTLSLRAIGRLSVSSAVTEHASEQRTLAGMPPRASPARCTAGELERDARPSCGRDGGWSTGVGRAAARRTPGRCRCRGRTRRRCRSPSRVGLVLVGVQRAVVALVQAARRCRRRRRRRRPAPSRSLSAWSGFGGAAAVVLGVDRAVRRRGRRGSRPRRRGAWSGSASGWRPCGSCRMESRIPSLSSSSSQRSPRPSLSLSIWSAFGTPGQLSTRVRDAVVVQVVRRRVDGALSTLEHVCAAAGSAPRSPRTASSGQTRMRTTQASAASAAQGRRRGRGANPPARPSQALTGR